MSRQRFARLERLSSLETVSRRIWHGGCCLFGCEECPVCPSLFSWVVAWRISQSGDAIGNKGVPSTDRPRRRQPVQHNWSGYNQGTLEKGGTQFHRVSGTWVVPTATQNVGGEAEYSASWVGIGGGCVDANCTVGDATLIQAGTSQDVDASGAARYSAWWEIIPAPSTPIANFPVAAGNVIHVGISENPLGVWSITVQNQSTGKAFNMTTPYTS